jgi:ABC-2 type transport system permease protein
VGTEEAQRVLVPFVLATTEVDDDGQVVTDPVSAGRLLFFMGLGVMMMISVFTTSGYLLQGLTEEKENRIMEILLSSVNPEHLMLGKLFGLGAAGLLQMVLWGASGVTFLTLVFRITDTGLDIDLMPSFLGLLAGGAYFLLGYFFFATLMAALGAVTSTQREASQVTYLVVLPGIAPAWFMERLIENPEGLLARVASMVPFSAPLASLMRLGADGMGAIDLVISLSLLAASVAGAMWLTTRLFRAYLLMYGQRPGLRQIFRTLRAG